MKKAVAVVALLATTLLAMPSISEANNHADRAFNFSFSFMNPYDTTGSAVKEDASSVNICMRSRSKPMSFEARALRVGSGKQDIGSSVAVVDTIDKDYFITQNAYEWYGRGVQVRAAAHSHNGRGFNASGVWSPDSV